MDTQQFELNAGQLDGIDKIVSWYNDFYDRDGKQLFFLTGDAGTGKTSLARQAALECANEHQTVFIAPTGKAASVLRKKGCRGAKTLHQFIYNYQGEDEKGKLIFDPKSELDDRPLLVVMDEASMIGDTHLSDLLRHGFPVLALGDLSQIPPVNAAAALNASHIDHALTEITRQAAGSKIIQASQLVKQGYRLPPREYEDVRVRVGFPPLEDLLDHIGTDSQILAPLNKTRRSINNQIRHALGFTGPLPNPKEKVMCFFNQHNHNFMNGEQGIVEGYDRISPIEQDAHFPAMCYIRLISLTDGRPRRVKFNPDSFSDDEATRANAQKNIGGFDYGYACTIHKAQGSEWSRVLVIEQPMYGDSSYEKLYYTAITRAQERLTFYRRKT